MRKPYCGASILIHQKESKRYELRKILQKVDSFQSGPWICESIHDLDSVAIKALPEKWICTNDRNSKTWCWAEEPEERLSRRQKQHSSLQREWVRVVCSRAERLWFGSCLLRGLGRNFRVKNRKRWIEYLNHSQTWSWFWFWTEWWSRSIWARRCGGLECHWPS